MQSLARDISPSLVHARALRGVLRALSVHARFDVHAGLGLAFGHTCVCILLS